MPQSNVIFAFLFAAFLVFITMRGELPTYLQLLFGAKTQGKLTVSSGPEGTASRPDDAYGGDDFLSNALRGAGRLRKWFGQ